MEVYHDLDGEIVRWCNKPGKSNIYNVLVSSSQLLPRITKSKPDLTARGRRRAMQEAHHINIPRDDTLAATFMPHFLPDQSCSSIIPGQTLLLHWELVRKLLRQCTAFDFTEMHTHLNHYIDYFTDCVSQCNLFLHYVINAMCHHAFRVIASEEVSMGQVRAVRERFLAKLLTFRDRRQLRLRNWSLIDGGNCEPAVEDFPEREFYSNLNSSVVYNLYACMGDFERDDWEVSSQFEECGADALVCFDHVFP